MQVIFEHIARLSRTDAEVRHAVNDALRLTIGKTGFRTETEIWRDCGLVVTLGHDLRTTTIRIRPPDNALWKRRCNWCNAYAYYAHGIFLGDVSNTKVELI